jgi:O-antigen/teichoic acid export membrane protein
VVLGQLVNQALSNVVQPRLAGLVATGDLAGAREIYRASATWIVALTWPVNLLVAVGAPVILSVLGPGYAGGVSSLVILAAAGLVAAGTGLVDFVLITVGRTSWNLINTALALAVNVVVDLLLIPSAGIAGAAIGWALAIVIANVLPLAQVRGRFGFQPMSRGWLAVASLAVLCFAAVPAGGRALAGDGGLVAGAACGTVVYLVVLWGPWRRLVLSPAGG